MNYFSVTAKFGHCGRNNYYEGTIYLKANNAKEAAYIVRWMPRVKHHKKDAILLVEKINYELYTQGQFAMKNNLYFRCCSIQDQRSIYLDPNMLVKEVVLYSENKGLESHKLKQFLLRKLQRKVDKYKNNKLEYI